MSEKSKILIVEDSKTQALGLHNLLVENGYEVSIAFDGLEAKAYLENFLPDIIITDIIMPDINGYELCRIVRNNERTKNIPIMLLTSLASPDDIIEGLKSGADNFITKPFDKAGLLARISYILLNKQLRETQPSSLGLNLFFAGHQHLINAERAQILDLFFSSYDAAIQKHRQLEATVKELSETQEYLYDARKEAESAMLEAEQAKEARGLFLANITHDLRSPLSAIIGIADLLCDTPLQPEQKEYATIIKNAGESLLAQINNILDFSKIDAGMLELEAIAFDLYEQVNIASSIFTKEISDKKLLFEINIDPLVPQYLVGDESKLRQIFINLLSNAVKYTSKGGVAFNISRIDFTAGKSARLRFEVIDTGIGIPKDKQQTLFHAFVQGHQSAARIYGGTGLGLSIVKQLVSKMGGTVALASEPGLGSTFSFEIEFPVSSEDAVRNVKTQKENGLMQTQRITLLPEKRINDLAKDTKKILIVEDSKVYQRLEREMLESWGFKFEQAENGQEACRIFRERGNEFNLILMDCQMPVMDGYQAAAEIRKIEQSQNIARPVPIIALTAGSDLPDANMCSNAGMNDYIEKPLKKKQLEECLAKWL
ncbi:MAG: response regulator [Victivallaceae bacterium]|jgi:signal transduction histidine kinase